MARGKKTTAVLTPEEKLQQALVPIEEQPYKIPENWCWVYLPCLCEYMRAGGDKPSVISNIKTDLCPVPIIANGIQEDGIIGYTDKENEKPRTVTVSGRGTIGYAVVRNYTYYPVVRLIVLSPNRSTLPEYIKLCFDNFEEKGTGSSIPQLTVPSLKTKRIPLPPLVEQQRIVDRIESIFAKLDEAKEKAQAVVDGFELRKSAILHKAFTGELTARWRQEHYVGLDNWKKSKLERVIKLLSGQDFKPAQYNDTHDGLPYIIGASNFDGDHVIINRWTPSPSVIAQKNDVLVVCKGSGYGKTIIADFDKAHIARQIMAIRVDETVLNRFIFYYLQSEYEYLRNNGQGLIPGIARSVLLNMPIFVPTIEEQHVIVEIIERVMLREQQAKDAAEAVINQIDIMKKAVLARAFRGELGTNDPSEDSSLKYLMSLL